MTLNSYPITPVASESELLAAESVNEIYGHPLEQMRKMAERYGTGLNDAFCSVQRALLVNHKRKPMDKLDLPYWKRAELIASIDNRLVIPLLDRDEEAYMTWWKLALSMVYGLIVTGDEYKNQLIIHFR